MVRFELQLVLIPVVAARCKRLVRPDVKRREDALKARVERVLDPGAVLEVRRERDVVRLGHLLVLLIEIQIVAGVGMQLAKPVLAELLGTRPDAEVDEVLADAGALDEADVVAEVVAQREKRVLRVEEVVVPRDRALRGELALGGARRF